MTVSQSRLLGLKAQKTHMPNITEELQGRDRITREKAFNDELVVEGLKTRSLLDRFDQILMRAAPPLRRLA